MSQFDSNQGLQVEGEQIPQQPRRAYRYRVTGSEGAGIAAVADSKHMLEWEFRGLQYSWTIFNFQTGQPVGAVHGEFLDKGWLLNGVYEPEEAA